MNEQKVGRWTKAKFLGADGGSAQLAPHVVHSGEEHTREPRRTQPYGRLQESDGRVCDGCDPTGREVCPSKLLEAPVRRARNKICADQFGTAWREEAAPRRAESKTAVAQRFSPLKLRCLVRAGPKSLTPTAGWADVTQRIRKAEEPGLHGWRCLIA